MSISTQDRDLLRSLADRVAAIAALPAHRQTAGAWRRLNNRKKTRPLVWINEIPWHEMDVNGELTLRARDPFCQGVEQTLRQVIYQWDHLPGDMVVEPVFHSTLSIRDTGFGIAENVHAIAQDPRGGIISREFIPQIRGEKDLDKIKTPVITHDVKASEQTFQTLSDLFGDILTIRKVGIVHCWFAPWDELIRWWDVQEALTDLAMRPELVHQAMDRLVNAYLARLKQWRELNVLSVTDGNYRVGSGGLGYVDDLPGRPFDPARVTPANQWGCATAQIFSDVSPAMHEEFALQYERRWLKNFGLNYYGCCEPLHNKLDILAGVPNLRKVSMSPWADVGKYVEKAGSKYVLSHKPSPAVLATDDWNLPLARKNLETVLQQTRGCSVEVIMKDISTVHNQPQRLWDWAKMAMEVVGQYE